ncbi:hypothetical protein OG474_41210 [Kribbella sp. NBC_01505]|uniref:hypothetical protein n=1 Tax=Kribbella sp. NBC_01505 TaxID=2903580 RepID=UPI0038654CAD
MAGRLGVGCQWDELADAVSPGQWVIFGVPVSFDCSAQCGGKPLVLGGEHWLTAPVVRSAQKPNLAARCAGKLLMEVLLT